MEDEKKCNTENERFEIQVLELRVGGFSGKINKFVCYGG